MSLLGVSAGPNGAVLEIEAALVAAQRLHASYRLAEPFPHVVIDDFLDVTQAYALHAAFPQRERASVVREGAMQNGKFGYRPMTLAGQESLRLLELCNSEPMARFLEALTGHRDLQPDDEAIGGGFHEMVQGGHLSIHADFSKHPKRRLARRINLLLYLQPDWDETWGGELELWHPDLRGLAARIVPHFNRAVIFDTTATSFHGHPQPLTCPPNQSRKSLALYFYNRPKFCERLTTRTLWRP